MRRHRQPPAGRPQRQRLAIARAVIRRPEIYLFDDSFSALDMATDALTEDTFVRDNRLPGDILAIGYGFPGNPYQRGIYMVTHSPATGLMLQAFDQTRNAVSSVKLADAWSRPTTVSFIQLPRTMLAIGAPGEANAQDASSAYGKLVELEVFNPNLDIGVPPEAMAPVARVSGSGVTVMVVSTGAGGASTKS